MEQLSREFRGCFAKVERARELMQSLQAEVNAFMEAAPYSLRLYFYAETGEQVVCIETVRECPLRWAVIFGEIGHNLRSALDHLVYELARVRNSNPSGAKTSFPIYSIHDTYWTPRKKRASPREEATVGVPDHARAIIDRAQPYHRGNAASAHPLATLAWLTNVDKHRLVHAVVVMGAGQNLIAAPAGANDRIVSVANPITAGTRLEPGTEVARVRIAPDQQAEVNVKGEIACEIAFGEREIAMREIYAVATYVISIFVEISKLNIFRK